MTDEERVSNICRDVYDGFRSTTILAVELERIILAALSAVRAEGFAAGRLAALSGPLPGAPLTAEERKNIGVRWLGTTHGEWVAVRYVERQERAWGVNARIQDGKGLAPRFLIANQFTEGDADFVAEAHADVPKLLDHAEYMESLFARLARDSDAYAMGKEHAPGDRPALLAILERLEWSGGEAWGGSFDAWPSCPCCGKGGDLAGQPHKKGCELAKVLGRPMV